MTAHDHDWLDVTAHGDLERKFVCTGCDARRSEGDPDGARPQPDGNAARSLGTPVWDEWVRISGSWGYD